MLLYYIKRKTILIIGGGSNINGGDGSNNGDSWDVGGSICDGSDTYICCSDGCGSVNGSSGESDTDGSDNGDDCSNKWDCYKEGNLNSDNDGYYKPYNIINNGTIRWLK